MDYLLERSHGGPLLFVAKLRLPFHSLCSHAGQYLLGDPYFSNNVLTGLNILV